MHKKKSKKTKVNYPCFQVNFKSIGRGSFKDADGDMVDGVKIEGYASTKDEDRVNDIVQPEAFEESIKTTYKDNPIILYQHDRHRPIGTATSMVIDGKGLKIEAVIYDEEVARMVEKRVLRTFSIGYMPQEIEYRDAKDELIDMEEPGAWSRVFWEEGVKAIIKKLELYEISVVSIPANAGALFSLAKSFDAILEGQKEHVLKNNPQLMNKSVNLLKKDGEEVEAPADAPESTEEAPEEGAETVEEETTTQEEAPESEAPDSQEEGKESGETPESPAEASEEGTDDEKSVKDDGGEESTETEEETEEPEPEEEVVEEEVEEEEGCLTEEEEADMKALASVELDEDMKNFTLKKEFLTEANFKALLQVMKGKDAYCAALEEKLKSIPAKEAKVFRTGLPENDTVPGKAGEESGKHVGFKNMILNRAGVAETQKSVYTP